MIPVDICRIAGIGLTRVRRERVAVPLAIRLRSTAVAGDSWSATSLASGRGRRVCVCLKG